MVEVYGVIYTDETLNILNKGVFTTDRNIGRNPKFACTFSDPIFPDNSCPFTIIVREGIFEFRHYLNSESHMALIFDFYIHGMKTVTILDSEKSFVTRSLFVRGGKLPIRKESSLNRLKIAFKRIFSFN